MPRWGLVVEENRGYGRHSRTWSVEVIGHVEGTHEEALAALRLRAERFAPFHPAEPGRRELYQEANGFLLVVHGFWQPFHCRFSVAEQLYDSAAPEPVAKHPDAPAADREGPAPKVPVPPESKPRAPDPGPPPAWDAQVPEVPSWLGRDDLP
ncbi:hypothetical protein ACWD04_06070 [Streptomyces sp. NPDC002911]